MTQQQSGAAAAARNAEIVRATFDALNRGDIDELLSIFDPEVEVLDHANNVTTRGAGQFRQWMRQYLAAWEYYREFAEDIVTTGDKVVVCVRSEGRGAGSGLELCERHGEIHVVRDGHITQIVIYPTFQEARRAAGLDP